MVRNSVLVNVNEAPIKKTPAHLADRAAVASSLDEIADAVRGAPDIDARKIKAARDALASGTYQVDPDRIARKLLRLDIALSHGRKLRGTW